MANPLILSGIFDIGAKLIDRIIPDKQAAADAKLRLLELDQQGELAKMTSEERRMLAQTEVIKIDAQSSSSFQKNWRPFIGWNCGLGFSYEFLVRPFFSWFILFYDKDFPQMPSLDSEALTALTIAMLGLGVYRTTEKLKGAVR